MLWKKEVRDNKSMREEGKRLSARIRNVVSITVVLLLVVSSLLAPLPQRAVLAGEQEFTWETSGTYDDDAKGFVDASNPSRKEKIFYIDVATAGVITAYLCWSGTADLDLYLLAPDGVTVLASATSGTLNPEILRYSTSLTGKHQLKVVAFSGSAYFTLCSVFPQGSSTSNGWQGSLANGAYADYYIGVSGNGHIYASAAWNNSSGSDLDLFVYDPTGNEIARAYTLANPERCKVYVTTAGTYKIRIDSYNGAASYVLSTSYVNSPGATIIDAPCYLQSENNWCGVTCAQSIIHHATGTLYTQSSLHYDMTGSTDRTQTPLLYQIGQTINKKITGNSNPGNPYYWKNLQSDLGYGTTDTDVSNFYSRIIIPGLQRTTNYQRGYPIQLRTDTKYLTQYGGLSLGHYVFVYGCDASYAFYADPHYNNLYFGKHRDTRRNVYDACRNYGGGWLLCTNY